MPVTRLASRRPAPTPGPSGSHPGGPLGRYLQNPGGSLHHLEHAAIQWAAHWGPLAAALIALAGVTLVIGRVWWRRRQHAELVRDARLVTVLAPPVVDPAGATALWSNLTGLLRPAWRRRLTGQPHVAFEYAFDFDGLTLRLWVPGVVPPGMVEHAIQAAWPGAHTTTQPVDSSDEQPTEAPALAQRRLVSGGELRLARSEALPIRTGFDADPIRALLGAPAGLLPGEQAVVQVLARPVTGRRVAQARRAATRLHTGSSTRPVGRLLDLFTPHLAGGGSRGGPTTRRASGPALDAFTSLEHSAQDRAAAGKQRGALFETRIRYTLTTPVRTDATKATVAAAGDRLRGRAHAIASAFSVFAEHNHYQRRRLRHPDQDIESRRLGRGDLLSIPELAALAHIPTDAFAPGLQQAGARVLPPPPGIPTPTRSNTALVKPLGHADTGRHRPVGLAVPDARHHTHLLGATGSGKSTLLAQLVLADADAGRGAVVIDPKGDLITDILDRLPRRAAERVVLMDADSRATPPCLNPLDAHPDLGPTPTTTGDDSASGEGIHPDDELDGRAQVVVDNLTSIFARVYSAFWGPRTDDIFRAACLTLRAQPSTSDHTPSLGDVPTLLTDPGYRDTATTHVTDPVLTEFWDWYAGLSDAARAQAIAPLMNKVRAFLLRPFVKAAIAGGPTTLDMRAVLDDGGICLIRIPKGSLGEETTRLVGSLVVASVWQTATARAAIPQNLRPDCGLYVDECQNFLNLPYPLEDMLAEARGFRLAMTLAHQHLGQLTRDLHDGIAANARNKIFFTASPDDARQLARHTAPRLSEHDLAHLDAFHAAARLVVAGQATAPFTFTTTPLPAAVPGAARAIRRASANSVRGTRRRGGSAGLAVATAPASASGTDPRLELASPNDPGPDREREGS